MERNTYNFRTSGGFSSYSLINWRESWCCEFEKANTIIEARKKNIAAETLMVSEVTRRANMGDSIV